MSWWTKGSPYAEWDGVIADGAIRSSKTVGCIDGFLTWSLSSHKSQDFIVAGRSMGALLRNVVNPMKDILNSKGIGYYHHRSENWIQVGTNTYWLFGASNEKSQDVLQGMTSAGLLVDEAALIPESFIDQAIGRCSIAGAKLWFNCNPGPPKHFFKTKFIDRAKEKRLLYLHFTMDDNPSLAESVKARFRRMFSGVWFKRFILGQWVVAEGAIYDMFDEAAHVVKDLPPMIRYWVGIDYGTSNPTVFLLLGQGKDDCLYVCREWVWDSSEKGRQKTDKEYSDALRSFIGRIAVSRIYIDPSAASFSLQLTKDKMRGVTPADNSVVEGIRNVSTLLSAGRLKVHASCEKTIQGFHAYVWDPKAQERGEDKPLKENDHECDALRYPVRMLRQVWLPWVQREEAQHKLELLPHQIA